MSVNNNRGSSSSHPMDNEFISPLRNKRSSIKETDMIQLKQMSVVKDDNHAEINEINNRYIEKKQTEIKSNYSLISVQTWKRSNKT